METQEPNGENVRKVTSTHENSRIDTETILNIEKYSKNPDLISKRITQLDKEWDIERVLEISMASLAVFGISMAAFVTIYSLILPSIMLLFLIQHTLQGWCPPIPLLRRFKVRTRPEIDREKYALKAIRGDFSKIEFSNLNPLSAFRAAQKIC
jgi:hypothetical protein